ncbi:MAG: sigma-54-dependent Fis family transcriptional regulator [Geminicoccaceae bacterium]|nr:MAG: sigma-54-dependent Fis family transcriptional regulator [Geminicoccaceae bacterium]
MSAEILIVDDEAAIREVVADILEDEGYGVLRAAESREALALVDRRPPDLVLLDVWLEGSELDGIEVLDAIRAREPELPVLIISGHGTIETAVQAIRKGAYDFLEKPFKSDRLLVAIERALEAARLRREIAELRLRAGADDQLIGRSSAINQVRQAIERVAPTNSRVLITGPAGVGKEIVARSLHASSRRAQGPFMVINAASLAPERVAEELFGLEEAGPSGGRVVQVGMLERAHTGTLLIDEVSDMPLETQGKLLRVLQEQRFQRVGGRQEVAVDVRILAATHAQLEDAIAAGRFREDLYYRLNVVPVHVPSLHQRRDDIPLFVDHFVQVLSRAAGLHLRSFTAAAITTLQAADWPGNVRELKNAVERILIMAPGDPRQPIDVEHLPHEIVHGANAALDIHSADYVTLPLREARERFERAYLSAQLERFGGNVSRTAAFVGMERSALHRKLRSLELQGDGER